MEASLIGTLLGNYEVESLIGQGAMAEVYRGRHIDLDRLVAIKKLHSFLVEKEDMLDRFRREARNIAALTHPNIVQVYDFERADDFYFMVMEYIEGITLKDMLRDVRAGKNSLKLKQSIRIARDVASALAYAHGMGVVHRDIKPANVMLEESGRVVLMDFGLARLLSGPQHTTTGTIVGTPAYMSPEQGKGESGDERSDIYSLGAMLYELSCGYQPFTGETPIAVIFKHINAPVPSPRDINPEIPVGLEQIIYRAMEKNPAHRYPNVKDLEEDLEIILSDRSLSSGTGAFPIQEELPPTAVELSFAMLDSGHTFTLTGKDRYVLGRLDGAFEPDVDFSGFQGAHMGVSRLHAEVEVLSDQRVRIVDLNSTNGTWVNGQPVSSTEPTWLNRGDLIALGQIMLQVNYRPRKET